MNNDDKYRLNISTQVNYLAEQSDEMDNRFVFSYTITLTNVGDMPVKLLSRHWIITDANREVQEVRGQGVVGEQPVLTSPGRVSNTPAAPCSLPR